MNLRIYGNRSLKTLPGQSTRPTPSRVREALFNIWQGHIEGCRWLDLCAGSGAMGAEALCRGADAVTGIEQSSAACRVIDANWRMVAAPEQTFELLKGDVVKQITHMRSRSFDRIYFDPPYTAALYVPVLETIARLNLLDVDGEMAVEHNRDFWQAQPVVGLIIVRQKHYGYTSLTFYQRQGEPPES